MNSGPVRIFLALLLFSCAAATAFSEEPLETTPCKLKNDPSAYNHKLVALTGFISHGFEDFTLFDPNCPYSPELWLEYGGTAASGTMYCCGASNNRSRPGEMVVEGIPIPLVEDDLFRRFDKLILHQPDSDSVVHAKLVGRFFAGERQRLRNGNWGGYGHMGCCSLLAIQQVLHVDPHDRDDLDYSGSPDQPDVDKLQCGYQELTPPYSYRSSLEAQQEAEAGERAWAFTDPLRVASDALAELLKVDKRSVAEIKETRKTQGRVVYEWHPDKNPMRYMVVVSRPYWLSFMGATGKRFLGSSWPRTRFAMTERVRNNTVAAASDSLLDFEWGRHGSTPFSIQPP